MALETRVCRRSRQPAYSIFVSIDVFWLRLSTKGSHKSTAKSAALSAAFSCVLWADMRSRSRLTLTLKSNIVRYEWRTQTRCEYKKPTSSYIEKKQHQKQPPKKKKAVKINNSAVAVAFAVATWPAGTAISSANKAATWEVATAVPRSVNKPATLVDTIATSVL